MALVRRQIATTPHARVFKTFALTCILYFSLAFGANEWSPVIFNNTAPSSRMMHTNTLLNLAPCGGLTLMFGGIINTSSPVFEFTNETWIFRIETNSYVQVLGVEKAPTPRAGHTAVLIGDSAYIFGGYDQSSAKRDVWFFRQPSCDGSYMSNSWVSVDYACDDNCPAPRWGHSAIAYNNNMLVHGGSGSPWLYCNIEGLPVIDDGLWLFDTELLRWTHLLIAAVPRPAPRMGSGECIYLSRAR